MKTRREKTEKWTRKDKNENGGNGEKTSKWREGRLSLKRGGGKRELRSEKNQLKTE